MSHDEEKGESPVRAEIRPGLERPNFRRWFNAAEGGVNEKLAEIAASKFKVSQEQLAKFREEDVRGGARSSLLSGVLTGVADWPAAEYEQRKEHLIQNVGVLIADPRVCLIAPLEIISHTQTSLLSAVMQCEPLRGTNLAEQLVDQLIAREELKENLTKGNPLADAIALKQASVVDKLLSEAEKGKAWLVTKKRADGKSALDVALETNNQDLATRMHRVVVAQKGSQKLSIASAAKLANMHINQWDFASAKAVLALPLKGRADWRGKSGRAAACALAARASAWQGKVVKDFEQTLAEKAKISLQLDLIKGICTQLRYERQGKPAITKLMAVASENIQMLSQLAAMTTYLRENPRAGGAKAVRAALVEVINNPSINNCQRQFQASMLNPSSFWGRTSREKIADRFAVGASVNVGAASERQRRSQEDLDYSAHCRTR
jgi:hypothetical protein